MMVSHTIGDSPRGAILDHRKRSTYSRFPPRAPLRMRRNQHRHRQTIFLIFNNWNVVRWVRQCAEQGMVNQWSKSRCRQESRCRPHLPHPTPHPPPHHTTLHHLPPPTSHPTNDQNQAQAKTTPDGVLAERLCQVGPLVLVKVPEDRDRGLDDVNKAQSQKKPLKNHNRDIRIAGTPISILKHGGGCGWVSGWRWWWWDGWWAQHPDCKPQSTSNKHGHQVEHAWRVRGGIKLRIV